MDKAKSLAEAQKTWLSRPDFLPYPRHSRVRSLGAAGATEGPARQLWPATLASPPPRGVCSWRVAIIVYFQRHLLHLFLCPTPYDCLLARAGLLCLWVTNLWIVCRKDTQVQATGCPGIFSDDAYGSHGSYPRFQYEPFLTRGSCRTGTGHAALSCPEGFPIVSEK